LTVNDLYLNYVLIITNHELKTLVINWVFISLAWRCAQINAREPSANHSLHSQFDIRPQHFRWQISDLNNVKQALFVELLFF